MTTIVIDAQNQIIGRLATQVAKLALQGRDIAIVNCSKAVVVGKRSTVIALYLQKMKRGIPQGGPYYPKQSHLIVKRTIRGMLPYKSARGEEAFKRIKCYAHVPLQYQGAEMMQFENADVTTSSSTSYVLVQDIAQQIGGKQ